MEERNTRKMATLEGSLEFLTCGRLKKMGISQEESYPLCRDHVETINHLIFGCEFSNRCLIILTQWTSQHVQNKEIEGYWEKIARKAKRKPSRAISWTITVATIYHIWKARDEAVWHYKVPRPQR